MGATPMQTDSDRTDPAKRERNVFRAAPKRMLYKLIWIEEWQPDSPTHQPGWQDFFDRTKSLSETVTRIYMDPTVQPKEAQQLANWLRPIRIGMCNGDPVNDCAGQIFMGWMPSELFLGLVSQVMAPPDPEELFRALDVAQFPPILESPPEVLNNKTMLPLVNVLWTKSMGKVHYFVRLNPYLRYPDSLLGPDGVRQPKGPERSCTLHAAVVQQT
jgi:hypothetical protein